MVEVVDTTGAGDHFDARVAAPAFAGLGLVDQHRLVYEALGDLMQVIHALSLQDERGVSERNEQKGRVPP